MMLNTDKLTYIINTNEYNQTINKILSIIMNILTIL